MRNKWEIVWGLKPLRDKAVRSVREKYPLFYHIDLKDFYTGENNPLVSAATLVKFWGVTDDVMDNLKDMWRPEPLQDKTLTDVTGKYPLFYHIDLKDFYTGENNPLVSAATLIKSGY